MLAVVLVDFLVSLFGFFVEEEEEDAEVRDAADDEDGDEADEEGEGAFLEKKEKRFRCFGTGVLVFAMVDVYWRWVVTA